MDKLKINTKLEIKDFFPSNFSTRQKNEEFNMQIFTDHKIFHFLTRSSLEFGFSDENSRRQQSSTLPRY